MVFADGGNVADTAQPQTTNVVSPTGDLVSVDNSDLPAALHPVNGYRLATPEDEQAYTQTQKYGGVGQGIQAGIEGALQSATFGVIPGVGKAEDIAGRAAEHPIANVAGSVLPFAAESLVPGVGEAGMAAQAARAATTVPRLIGEAGEAIKNASGLSGVSAKALQYAAESAIMQGSNEVSKALLKDPDQTAASVMADEGLASLFGGALGVAAGGIGKTAALWNEKFGAKASDAVIDKSIPDIVSQSLTSGIQIPDSLSRALSGDQDAYNRAQVLQKSDTIYGRALQNDVSKIYDQAENNTLQALGKTPDVTAKAPNAYNFGADMKDALRESIEAQQKGYGPVYDELRNDYKNIPVSADQRAVLAGNLSKAISENGLGALQGSAEHGQIGGLFRSIDNLADADGIKNLNTGVNQAARNPDLQRFAAVISPVLKDFESNVVTNHLQNIAEGSAPQNLAALAKITQKALKNQDPAAAIEAAAQLESAMKNAKAATSIDQQRAASLLGRRKAADNAFKQAMGDMNTLKGALGLGRFKGTNGFLRALDEKSPEQILQRLGNKNRQELIEFLQQRFPKVAERLKDWHLSSDLYDARLPGGGLNTKKFLNAMFDGEKNPQHIQDFMMGPAASQRLQAIKQILNALPKDGNPSNSAAMIDKLWKGKIGTLVGGTLGVGGGHIAGGILGGASDHVLREINPFLSYKILEMRGAGKQIVPSQVKAMFDYAKSAAQGNMAIEKGVNALVNRSQVVPSSKVPSEADRNRLDRYVSEIRKDPSKLTSVASDMQENMPDHTGPLAMTAQAAANYLTSIKPQPALGGMLDTKTKPSQAQQTEYHRQLDIAEQPLMILKHMQDGDLTPNDVSTLKNCHPASYQVYQQKIMQELANPGVQIPYKTRLSMSLFLGQPLDSTMTPASIIAAQPLSAAQVPQGGAPGNKPKRSTSSLNKLPGQYQTPAQAADSRRSRTE